MGKYTAAHKHAYRKHFCEQDEKKKGLKIWILCIVVEFLATYIYIYINCMQYKTICASD
jgi:hypothetical protein